MKLSFAMGSLFWDVLANLNNHKCLFPAEKILFTQGLLAHCYPALEIRPSAFKQLLFISPMQFTQQ